MAKITKKYLKFGWRFTGDIIKAQEDLIIETIINTLNTTDNLASLCSLTTGSTCADTVTLSDTFGIDINVSVEVVIQLAP